MTPKDLLAVLMTPVGLCDPGTLRLVWHNDALTRMLEEHGLERSVSVRALAPDLPGTLDLTTTTRAEAALPAHGGARATAMQCQLGPELDLQGDTLLLFQMSQSGGADASRATLSIFSRHMNAQTTAWEKERAALLEQIQALQAKQTP
jgi:hypothetical protein